MKLEQGLNEEYIGVGIDVLVSGMKIDYNIYREYDNAYILLCKDVILTDELIMKFKKITVPNYKIYIPKSQYGRIFNERARLKNASHNYMLFTGYEDVKKETAQMLEIVLRDEIVPRELVENIAETVRVQVETVDISLIVESINRMRSVDEYLHTHSVNVALLNGLIGRWLHYDELDLVVLVKIGLLHDIGKLKVPKDVLDKPSRLTKEEFDMIKNHPIYAYEILTKSKDVDERILNGVVQHHEKVNGSGYPYGLNMDEITEFARITSISDVYDAMVAKRVYKDAHPPFQILGWLNEGRYSELDIKYVDIFLECMMEELRGKNVLLSNGKTAKVVYVQPTNITYPIVQIGEEIIHTNSELYPVALQLF